MSAVENMGSGCVVEMEWDVGYGLRSSWDSRDEAEKALRKAFAFYESELRYTYEEAVSDGLISFE